MSARCESCKRRLADGDEAMLVPYRHIDVSGKTVTFAVAERLVCLSCAGEGT